jgi:macrolide transport system ATP-binding/permease protein
MSTLGQDLRYAWRRLRHSPGFALVCVATLALGIGANTAIFTLVHAVILKSLPVANPNQLYRLGNDDNCCVIGGMLTDPRPSWAVSLPWEVKQKPWEAD